MKSAASIWKLGWRLAICTLLLAWIFHSIFLQEGQKAFERGGQAWASLSKADQWAAAWSHGPAELWENLRGIDPRALLVSFAIVGLAILLGVLRWQLVLRVQGLSLSFGRAARISLIAQFFNSFLLGSTGGDLLKAYYAARETHHKKTEAVVTVVIDRLIGLASMLLFASLMMLPNYDLLVHHERLGPVAGLILLMTLSAGAFLGIAFWSGVSNLLPRARHWLKKLPKGEYLERSLDASRQFGRNKFFLLRAASLSMGVNVLCVLQIVVLSRGIGVEIDPLALAVIVPIIICLASVPVTPSGLGVRENLFVLMLAAPTIGVAATDALSISLLAFAGSLFWSLVGGVVYVSLKSREHLSPVEERDEISQPG